jgi:exosortase/archaeosortase family protein
MLAGALTTAAMLALALPVCTRLETVRRVGFCLPSAVFASDTLGVPCLTDPDGRGYTIPVTPMPIHVVLECSAIRYFCIAAAILTGLCVERRRLGLALLMFPAAYLLTIVANTSRIVCAWLAQRLAIGYLSAEGLSSVHMAVGAACFIIFLIVAYGLIERSLSYGRSKAATG